MERRNASIPCSSAGGARPIRSTLYLPFWRWSKGAIRRNRGRSDGSRNPDHLFGRYPDGWQPGPHSLPRGFDDLLGACTTWRPASFCYERLRSHTSATTGELIYNFLFAPAGAEAGGFYRLTPHAGCEVLSDFLDPNYTAVQPGLVRFENRLGGRVAIMAFDLQQTQSSAIFCYRKKNALVRLLEWLNARTCRSRYCVIPISSCWRTNPPQASCFSLSSTSAGPRPLSLGLSIADEWAGSEIHRLSLAGQWEPLDTVWGDRQAELALELSIMQPEYLRLRVFPAGR